MQFLPIVFAVVVGIIYYFSNQYRVRKSPSFHKIMSFSAGVSITYVLLEFFPLFTKRVVEINDLLFITVLFGFISHHLIEKRIYQHNHKHELQRLLNLEENAFSFIYHIILGILLVALLTDNFVSGLLLFIPVSSYVFVSALPMKAHPSKLKTFMLSTATLIGTLFATFFWVNRSLWAEALLIGLALGVLLYTVIRHHIPYGRAGRISYFSAGFILYSIMIVVSWYI